MVLFLEYSLMPVLNVYDNVALPVTLDRGKHISHKYVEELLRELESGKNERNIPVNYLAESREGKQELGKSHR